MQNTIVLLTIVSLLSRMMFKRDQRKMLEMMQQFQQPLEEARAETKKFNTKEEKWTELQKKIDKKKSRDPLEALPDLLLPLAHGVLAVGLDAADSITSHQPQVVVAHDQAGDGRNCESL